MDERKVRLASITLALDGREQFDGIFRAAERAHEFINAGGHAEQEARIELFKAVVRCNKVRPSAEREIDIFDTLEKLWVYVDRGEVAELDLMAQRSKPAA